MRYLFPHIFEVDLPLIVLKLSADFLYFFVDLLAIKVYFRGPPELAIQLIVELFFECVLEHIKQMTDLAFILEAEFI